MFNKIKQPASDQPSERFVIINKQVIGAKELIVFVDTESGVEYMTDSFADSKVMMLRNADGDPLVYDGEL